MAREPHNKDNPISLFRRLIVAALIFFLLGLFVLWRLDSPRIERVRMEIIDRVMPSFAWVAGPVHWVGDISSSVLNHSRIYQQNQELRREVQQLKAWRELALQLEQENARLLDLNNVRLDPSFTHVTGVVMADSGSDFHQSVLLNVGHRDGILDGWATMDGLGLVGRISGVGKSTSRVIMLTDTSSRIAVTIEPSGQNALLVGDNTIRPAIDFIENPDAVRLGDRVVTSGDGGVLPAGLLIGKVVSERSGRLRVSLFADLQQLEFLRVLRNFQRDISDIENDLVGMPLNLGPHEDG